MTNEDVQKTECIIKFIHRAAWNITTIKRHSDSKKGNYVRITFSKNQYVTNAYIKLEKFSFKQKFTLQNVLPM